MKDNRKLQYIILQLLTELDHTERERTKLIRHTHMRWANLKVHSRTSTHKPSDADIAHQLKLLTDKKEVEETIATWFNYPNFFYEITATGHEALAPWYRKLVGAIGHQLGAIIAAAVTAIIIAIIQAVLKAKFKLSW